MLFHQLTHMLNTRLILDQGLIKDQEIQKIGKRRKEETILR